MKIFSWGANSYGQLSHGIESEQCIFPLEAVAGAPLQDVIELAVGGCHTLALSSAGNVFGSGSNASGQLANCQNITTSLTCIQSLEEIKINHVSCGWESSFAITDLGTLLAWGSNKYGQLGISKAKVTTTNHPVPLEIPSVIQVSSGLRHTAVLTADGDVWMCGQGSKGQLGILSDGENVPPAYVDSLTKVDGVTGVKQVCCGQHHTLALTTEGELWGWGDNRRGQLGPGPAIQPSPRLITSVGPGACVRAGWTHTAVLSGGIVKSWGRNCYSQLGHSFGEEQTSTPGQVCGLSGVRQLELGSEHNIALLENGEVWSWGWNEHGNCGTGDTENVAAPQRVNIQGTVCLIAAGGGHSIALAHS